jgi:hypothetical protein
VHEAERDGSDLEFSKLGAESSLCSSLSPPRMTATASVFLLPLLGSFFAMLAPEDRVGGGYDLFLSRNGQLNPIFCRFAYGLFGFANSVTDDTSAKEEKDRDLPPKNFDRPGLLDTIITAT